MLSYRFYLVVLSRREARRRCPLDGFATSIASVTVMHTSCLLLSRHMIFPPKPVRNSIRAHDIHGSEHFPCGCMIMSDNLPACHSCRPFAEPKRRTNSRNNRASACSKQSMFLCLFCVPLASAVATTKPFFKTQHCVHVAGDELCLSKLR